MSQQPQESTSDDPTVGQVVIIGPQGVPIAAVPASATEEAADSQDGVASLVQQPAKVMRIGSMIKQLLDEVKSAPLDEAARTRLREIHQQSIKELEEGLAPELVAELDRLALPFADGAPSEAELRVAQAQLVGWLEGLFHGIQAALFAQQMSAKAQFEEMRRQAAMPAQIGAPQQHAGPGQYL